MHMAAFSSRHFFWTAIPLVLKGRSVSDRTWLYVVVPQFRRNLWDLVGKATQLSFESNMHCGTSQSEMLVKISNKLQSGSSRRETGYRKFYRRDCFGAGKRRSARRMNSEALIENARARVATVLKVGLFVPFSSWRR